MLVLVFSPFIASGAESATGISQKCAPKIDITLQSFYGFALTILPLLHFGIVLLFFLQLPQVSLHHTNKQFFPFIFRKVSYIFVVTCSQLIFEF